ncbi:crotonobetainyl-CoA:carnitine CoA-transferase CaiB-like acyl-CoA transferase [Cytobacillus horneckiae]|uniref:CoA transferase n=1 Tax=Cytobacillus horneckiae TaxID=549687 RepID=A0A2N0ZD84_9BACI|nr:CaiB/BaiF CoA-transferase family protein [Cytobacillus horneckiae]MBN6887348.1 CoA transferase [Cytobacillus horneckiae]MCM3178062.1 CoA transferase [Cytobacillus horneckiae]MEC1157199.1 CaiB/BaiF CoA-transferase family protein [Cytobacillus horneckiae]MED2938132.1 CaiB/BaiF CoA-transferase family protein [Cytobacillus horneckiae]PKG27470.1 CoA transferase [Cytobacillus horneckiae]
MSRALEGVRIIDASRVLAGPFCTMILGDLGAEVIKIEHHQSGDETRGWGPPFVNGESAYYLCANRNKKSMTLNLKSEEGKEIFKALAKDSDVVVQNFKTGTLEKMGLGYEELRRINEGIIVASITGFGNNGPYKDLPGYDYIIQAMSGLMSITGEKEGGPMKVGVAIADVLTALYTCIGILSAIHQRHATGEGQELDISLMDCQIASLINVASNYLVGGIEPSRLGNEHPNIAPYQVFSASDGDLVVAVGNDQQFKRFAQVAGMPELAEDSRFKENRLRVEHRAELIPICESLLKQRSKNEWKKILDDAGIPNGPINSISEMFNDPHVEAREMIMKVDHPLIEGLQLAGSPIKLSKSPVKVRQSPPLYGEHTGEILKEVGYSEEDIKNLKINQVI